MNNFDAGFSFCGYHSDRDMDVAIGNFDEAMNAIAPDFSALSETVDGYDGGYFTGTKEGPLAIPLQIIVDEAPRSKLNKIGWWMRRGAVGQLIFDNMPYKYYMARVTSQATPPMYMHFSQTLNAFVYSGVINVTLTAYTPRAYLLDEVLAQYPDIGSAYDGVNDATGIVEPSVRPAKTLTNLTGTVSATLLNQGTAPAKAAITVTGTMEAGVTVSNLTTGQSFTLTAPDSAAHTYTVDAERGFVTETNGTTVTINSNVKTGHFIELASCMPFLRDVPCTVSGSTITFDASQPMNANNTYILAGSIWYPVTVINGNTVTVNGTPSSVSTVCVAQMNRIEITVPSGSSISLVQFDYRDTFY